jgi:hypothetical protein
MNANELTTRVLALGAYMDPWRIYGSPRRMGPQPGSASVSASPSVRGKQFRHGLEAFVKFREGAAGQMNKSPKRHGQITGLMKAQIEQIDHLPLALGGVRPTQGRTLAVMQVSGWIAILQCREHAAPARPVDAHGHDPEPVERGEGLR